MMNPSLATIPSAGVIASKLNEARQRGERRVAHRVPCRVRAALEGKRQSLTSVGQTVNLSASGLAIQLGQPLDSGTNVEVLLPHLDGEPTRLLGRVAHSRRVLTGTFEIGIEIDL